jgi:hypothetical protein
MGQVAHEKFSPKAGPFVRNNEQPIDVQDVHPVAEDVAVLRVDRFAASSRSARKARRREFDTAIFDLDGVATDTARVHAAAGRRVLVAFLRRRWAKQHVRALKP